MKVSDAHSWLLLLCLVQTNIEQVSAQCSVPTALCCPGANFLCIRGGCYCDQYCITIRDCCADYSQTCIQSFSTPSSTSPSSTTLSSSSLPTSPRLSSSTSTSRQSSSTSTTINKSSSSSSEPPPSSSSTPTSASSSTPQQKNINAIAVFHVHVNSGANQEAVLKSMEELIFRLEGTMRTQQCEDCRLRLLNIRKKKR